MKCPNCDRAWDRIAMHTGQCLRCGLNACGHQSDYGTTCILPAGHEGQHDDDPRR